MDTGTVVLVAIAVAAGGLVQGLSGLGFALVSAPVVSQVVPGTAGIGLVNALSIVQNLWLIARTDGRLAWVEIRRMLPGLAIGVALGWFVLRAISAAMFDVIVAASACGSIAWLLLAGRFHGPLAGIVSGVWGGAVNTVSGVGGPPIAAYLVTRGLDPRSYLRTLQVVFAVLSLVSLPLLGVYVPSVSAVVVWVLALTAGSLMGELLRHRLSPQAAQRIARIAIVVVCVAALVRSLWLLPTHLA
jgi:uncharacterized membrane protein YfcA